MAPAAKLKAYGRAGLARITANTNSKTRREVVQNDGEDKRSTSPPASLDPFSFLHRKIEVKMRKYHIYAAQKNASKEKTCRCRKPSW